MTRNSRLTRKIKMKTLYSCFALIITISCSHSFTSSAENTLLPSMHYNKIDEDCSKDYECKSKSSELYLCQLKIGSTNISGRGQGECSARRNLKKLLCSKKYPLKHLKSVSCRPDPSLGECPPKPRFCTYEYRPSVCYATKYNKQEIRIPNQPIAWGSNPCNAESKLINEVCNRGLVPSLLVSSIECRPNLATDMCPPKSEKCAMKSEQTNIVCTAKDDNHLIKSSGFNLCNTKSQLQHEICKEASIGKVPWEKVKSIFQSISCIQK